MWALTSLPPWFLYCTWCGKVTTWNIIIPLQGTTGLPGAAGPVGREGIKGRRGRPGNPGSDGEGGAEVCTYKKHTYMYLVRLAAYFMVHAQQLLFSKVEPPMKCSRMRPPL